MVSVQNKRSGALNLRFGVKLSPGLNEVAPEAWSKCKEDILTKHYLSRRDIFVVTDAVSEQPPPVVKKEQVKHSSSFTTSDIIDEQKKREPEPINDNDMADVDAEKASEMKAKDVIVLVQESKDVKWLENLLEFDARATVQVAIEKRLGELEED